ncbi:hypothetical protein K439DRAFT_1641766 [Ramaria rubella]|nr:hypothetical protein K439DRAFT_1641766 [Ramaria rubella]
MDTCGPADFGSEKQQHSLLVPSAGQDTYDEDDSDGDSAEDIKDSKRPSKKDPNPKDCRYSTGEEVCTPFLQPHQGPHPPPASPPPALPAKHNAEQCYLHLPACRPSS